MRPDLAPQGLVGAGERPAIGVHLSNAVKSKTNGAPTGRGRFYFTTQTTKAREFQASSGSKYSSPSRDLHPSFRAWNDGAMGLPEVLGPAGPGRFGIVRGNLIWADLRHSARWSRVCQKMDGKPAPPSRRPACEGNGISARRFVEMRGDEEVYATIPCPNEDCPFAMSRACKPSAHLVFRLRWNPADPFEAQFPSLICEWNTNGWQSLAAMRGLFELVLGTAALRTPEEVAMATAEERAAWLPGLARDFGVDNPSLLGLPFVMVMGERTKPAKPGQAAGTRYPVVSFSFDGDPAEWLMLQRRQRDFLAAGTAPAPLLLPSVQDPLFAAVTRHESRVEIMPEVVDPPAEARLLPEDVAALRTLAGDLDVSWDTVEEHFGGPVAEVVGVSVDRLRRRVQDVIEALRDPR
jgi:hypothetical protein